MFLNFEMFKLIILSDFQLFANTNQAFDSGCKGREKINTKKAHSNLAHSYGIQKAENLPYFGNHTTFYYLCFAY